MKETPFVKLFLVSGLILALIACTRPGSEVEPSAVPTLDSTVYPDLPPQRSLEHGGFEFLAPNSYNLEYFPGIVFVTDPDDYLFISLGGGYETQPVNPDDIIGQTLEALTGDVDGVNAAEPVGVTIAGEQGLAVSFQGVQDGEPVEGQLVYVLLGNQQSFTMIGIGEQEIWIGQGQTLFSDLLDHLAFFEATPLTDGCPVSSDPDYGYSPDKPIRVASIVPEEIGPLADFYFEFIRGPEDKVVSYQQIGTHPVENSLLDIYEVSHEAGERVELYIDEYHSGQLMVPQGFGCQY